jgi:hypothetical protein
MHRALILCAAALLVAGLSAATRPTGFGQPVIVAAGTQPFFSGYWRCNSGDLRVTPLFGPWFTWRSQSGGATSQATVYNDTSGGGWVNVGIDSAGGYWTQTSSGWQGSTMTYNGTYTNHSRSQSQRQVLTKVADNRFNVATYRNGALTGQNSCTRS